MMTEADVFIDDVKLQEEGVTIKLSSNEPILPSTNDQIANISGRHGSYDYGAFFDSRQFTLDCMFDRMSFTDLKFKIRDFVKLFVDGYGRPKTVKLRFGDEPDKFYYARLVGSIPLDRLSGMSSFTLPLTAFDPYAYSVAMNDEVTWGSEVITFTSSYTFGHTGSAMHTITQPQTIVETVTGDMLKPIIKINGTGTNVSITANGKTFSLGTFTNVDWLVDGENFTVIRNNLNGLQYFNGDFIELINGDNDITISGSNLNITFQVVFRDKYM